MVWCGCRRDGHVRRWVGSTVWRRLADGGGVIRGRGTEFSIILSLRVAVKNHVLEGKDGRERDGYSIVNTGWDCSKIKIILVKIRCTVTFFKTIQGIKVVTIS